MSEIKVLATGEDAVIKFLEAQGVPDFGIPSMLDSSAHDSGPDRVQRRAERPGGPGDHRRIALRSSSTFDLYPTVAS